MTATDGPFQLVDLGDRRVLTVDGCEYTTTYSERLVRMLIARKGARRAPLYFPFAATRAPFFLDPLLAYLRARGRRDLSVLEIGSSFGHMTEYLDRQPEIAEITGFDTDADFVAMVRIKVEDLPLARVREVRHLTGDETCRLPWPDGRFDVVLAVGVVEHLPMRLRRAQVDEYYRVLAPGGHIAFLDTPNRYFPIETHSVGLPLVQWLPGPLAWRYARLGRPRRFRDVPYAEFVADGTGWHNATLRECLPSRGVADVVDVTESAGYGWPFFRAGVRRRRRRLLLPAFGAACAALRAAGLPPSLGLPYLNVLFRRAGAAAPGGRPR